MSPFAMLRCWALRCCIVTILHKRLLSLEGWDLGEINKQGSQSRTLCRSEQSVPAVVPQEHESSLNLLPELGTAYLQACTNCALVDNAPYAIGSL